MSLEDELANVLTRTDALSARELLAEVRKLIGFEGATKTDVNATLYASPRFVQTGGSPPLWSLRLRASPRTAAPADSGTTDCGTPTRARITRAEILGKLVAAGMDEPHAKAVAYARCPWIDGVPVPNGLVAGLNEMVARAPPRPSKDDTLELLRRIEGIGHEFDAPEYVRAARLLRDELEEPAEEGTETSGGPHAGGPTDWMPRPEPRFKFKGGEEPSALPQAAAYSLSDELFAATSDILAELADVAMLFDGARSLADVLLSDRTRPLLSGGGPVASAAKQIPAQKLLGSRSSVRRVGRAFCHAFDALPEREQEMARRRVYTDEPETLQSIGDDVGITPERVRQIGRKVERAMQEAVGDRLKDAAKAIREHVGPASEQHRLDATIAAFCSDARPSIQPLAEAALRQELGYTTKDGVALRPGLVALAALAEQAAAEFTDVNEAVNEERLREKLEVDDDEVWEALISASGLTRVLGHLVTRDNTTIRVRLALLNLGRPATKEEIAEAAGSLEALRYIGNRLSNMPDIVRVTKDTWGFRDWTDDPYEGVVAEIIQRIQEDGGRTTVERLMAEIPGTFGVSAATVDAYLRTPRFTVANGSVELAETIQVRLRSLDSLPEIVWDSSGTPVLRFTVEGRYLSGYSLHVAPEVVDVLGVGPDDSATVPIRDPATGTEISVIWRTHNINGPEIGRIRPPLEELAISPGDEVFITLDPEGVRFTKDGSAFVASTRTTGTEEARRSGSRPSSSVVTSAALERMKSRRRL